jgi:hypothetical protein
MNDRLQHADPYDATRGVALEGAELDLLGEIMATPDVQLDERRSERGLRSRLVRAGLAAAAVTAMIAVPAVILSGNDDGPGEAGTSVGPGPHTPAVTTRVRYAAAVIKVAQANPRILVTAAGWKVRTVEGFSPESGDMSFQLGPDKWRDVTYADGGGAHLNDAPRFEISWYPRAQYDEYLADRAAEPGLQHVDVLGQRSQMISYSATDHAVMLPPQGKVFLELRGTVGDEAAFKRFLAEDLEQVDVDAWLAAMPASVVTSANDADASAALLAGVPLPPGFDLSALGSGVALDPYQYGAKVSGAVACGWLAEWQRARAAGDAAAQQHAVDAMATSHHWKVLADMDAEGDYPEVLWEYADQVAAGKNPTGYRSGLGCD